jgi:hypothetical protein
VGEEENKFRRSVSVGDLALSQDNLDGISSNGHIGKKSPSNNSKDKDLTLKGSS